MQAKSLYVGRGMGEAGYVGGEIVEQFVKIL